MKNNKEQIEKSIKLGNELIEAAGMNTEGYQEFWFKSEIKEWMNGEKHRLYINMKYGRAYKGQSKWRRGVSCEIDINTGSVRDVSVDYNNSRERSEILRIAEEMNTVLQTS